jgi:3-oxoacyl-[acyl-carrier protein] reductase
MQSGLDDATVLITGAAGGIGWACARAFADEGARLVLHAGRSEHDLRDRVAAESWAERAIVGAADLRNEHALDPLVEAACERFDRIDVAIINAGIWPAQAELLHEMEPARIREVLEINLLGAIWTARVFMRELARRGPRSDGRGASICLISSTASRFGEAGHLEYAVSKAGMLGLCRSLKNELVRLDPYARINVVEPGWVATPMAEATLQEPGVIEGVVKTMALRQIARPEDIARAVLYFSSPHLARHVSGEVLTVAGGMEGRSLWKESEIDPQAVRDRLDED